MPKDYIRLLLCESSSRYTFLGKNSGPTVCVTGAGAGVDSAWEQEKLEARRMLENAAESPASSATNPDASRHSPEENARHQLILCNVSPRVLRTLCWHAFDLQDSPMQ
jgi:hypothetical protein